jgi:PAS domain S-box-containing protein
VDAVAADDDYHPFARSAEMLSDLRDGEAVKFECRVKARDGRTFWVVGNAVGTLGVDGSRELTFALMDIEQRRQAEARVAEARASLQRIIEAAPMAIIVWDAITLGAQQMNRAALALSEGLTGVAADAHAGLVPEELYPAELASTIRTDMRQALAAAEGVTTTREYRVRARSGEQVWDAQFLPLRQADGRVAQLLMVASNVTDQRAAQRAELQAAIAQREMLVQEVHHRIKNNLQGVAGLMQQIGLRRPEVQPVMAEVVGQVQAIAQVYGLQVGTGGPLNACSVVEAIAQSVQRTFGRTITFAASGEQAAHWALPENESIPIALTLNELLTNAVKHSPAASPVQVHLMADAAGVTVQIGNEGGLPPGFRIEHRPQAVSGLGLVRALLPRRHASLAMEQRGSQVVATVSLAPPVVVPVAASVAAPVAA